MSETTMLDGLMKTLIQRGLTTEEMMKMMAAIREEKEKKINLNRRRLEKIYTRDLTDAEVLKLLDFEEEKRECDSCIGLPCNKKHGFSKCVPLVEWTNFGLIIRYRECIYQLQRRKDIELENNQIYSGVPSIYFGKTLKDFELDSNNASGVKYAMKAKTIQRGAYFFGDRGTGKTFLASIIAQEFLAAGYKVLFAKIPDISLKIRSAYSKGENEEPILKALKRVDLLILDDMGAEKSTMFLGSILCNVIDSRYDREKMTIITSNLSLEELQKQLDNATDGISYNGSRIVDRLRSMCKPILFKGESRRK